MIKQNCINFIKALKRCLTKVSKEVKLFYNEARDTVITETHNFSFSVTSFYVARPTIKQLCLI